jgi:hypothetical protein
MPNIHLPGMPGMRPAEAQMVLAQPFNDVQLIALVAAHMATAGADPSAAVETALDLVATVLVRFNAGGFRHYVELHSQGASNGRPDERV